MTTRPDVQPTIRTARLVLRPPTPADVDPLFAIQGDPEAMRFTYYAPSRDATAAFLEAYAGRFAEDGFAPWCAELAAEGRVVGWGGLNRDPKAPHWGTEIAYFVDPAYSRRGLATELVTAALAHGFDELDLGAVSAFARPENEASIRVLAKAGFARLRWVPELERDEFGITLARWRDARRPQAS